MVRYKMLLRENESKYVYVDAVNEKEARGKVYDGEMMDIGKTYDYEATIESIEEVK